MSDEPHMEMFARLTDIRLGTSGIYGAAILQLSKSPRKTLFSTRQRDNGEGLSVEEYGIATFGTPTS